MTEQIESDSDKVFFKLAKACEGDQLHDVAEAALDMIVSCVKESGDDEFAASVVSAMLTAAKYLDDTGARDGEPQEQSVIQLLN